MLIPWQMSTVEYGALLSILEITEKKEKQLSRYLQCYLVKGFCPSLRCASILAEGHSVIHTGSTQWMYDSREKEETVECSEKDIHSKLEILLIRELKGRDPSDVKAVQAVIGGDHGETAFDFGAAITSELHNVEWIYLELTTCK